MGKHTWKCLACGREDKQHLAVKYFAVPKNCERRAKWLSCLNKSHLIEDKFSADWRVCEDHFTKDMYSKSKFRLKFSATPSLQNVNNVSNIQEGRIREMFGEFSAASSNETVSIKLEPDNEDSQMLAIFDEANNQTIKVEADDNITPNPVNEEIQMMKIFDEANNPAIKMDADVYIKPEPVHNDDTQMMEVINEADDPTIKVEADDQFLDDHLSQGIKAEIFDNPVKEEEEIQIEDVFEDPPEEMERATKDQSTQTTFEENAELLYLRKQYESLKKELEILKRGNNSAI